MKLIIIDRKGYHREEVGRIHNHQVAEVIKAADQVDLEEAIIHSLRIATEVAHSHHLKRILIQVIMVLPSSELLEAVHNLMA